MTKIIINNIEYNSIKEASIKLNLSTSTISKRIKSNDSEFKKYKIKRNISGFAAPTKISDELCLFLNFPEGTLMSRIAVTKCINRYIIDNKLKNKLNSRQLDYDDKLKKLLNLKNNDVLTFFNIQRYLNKHFIKKII